MNYEKLSPFEFGNQLLITEDLDPVYVILYNANLNQAQLRRWCVAYWCSYHAGVSSWISEHQNDKFWSAMEIWGQNTVSSPIQTRWPRGRERRYFRGIQARNAIDRLQAKFPHPESLIEWIYCDSTNKTYTELSKRIQCLPMFGPWISFKVADMLERVFSLKVDFSDTAIYMYEEPYKAALLIYKLSGDNPNKTEEDQVKAVAQLLENRFNHYQAPPGYNRPVGPQEIETILCKWKSHYNGHYPIGLDTQELHHALREWQQVSTTAQHLLHLVPQHDTQLNTR
jgi:Alpha-glutamyl/putrescinyl thymine pyrophosphorylase clade 2